MCSPCPPGADCGQGLVPTDTNFSIIRFTATAGGEGFNGDVEEVINEGPLFSNSGLKSIIIKMKTGSYIQFSCIKARHKNGAIYTLQPFFIEIK